MKQSNLIKILLFSTLSFLGSTPLLADIDTPIASQTVISSDRLEMNNNGQSASFNFTGNIKLTGTNLIVTCDVLEVQTERNENPGTSTEKLGSISSIIAIGNVSISQRGRKATAGRAEVYPNEDKIILTENPKVIDDQGNVVTGGKMTLFRGVGRILIESDASNRPRVSSSSLPDLGFSEEEANKAVPTDSGLESPPSEENPEITPSPSTEKEDSSTPPPSQTAP